YWKKEAKAPIEERVDDCAQKIIDAKQLEHCIIYLLKDNAITPAILKDLKKTIPSHIPYINLERILNAALYTRKEDALIKFLLSLGAKPTRCKDVAHYIGYTAQIKPYSAVLKALAKDTCSAIPPPRDSVGKATILTGRATKRLQKLSYPGTKEHVLRSQLSALFGLHKWTATFDHLSRPGSGLIDEDISDYFTEIKRLEGIPECSIILTDKDLPLSRKKFTQITSDPTTPLIITSGWDEHACIVVLIGNKIYRGNRGARQADPGIYIGTFDRSKLTIESISHIISNTSATWFENTLPESLGAHWTAVDKLKLQTQENCTWASCAELSPFIFKLHEGVASYEAWEYTKTIRAKVRLNFVKSYLSYDRSKMPHLHSAPLLGKILAKCYLKITASHPEYIEAAGLILSSGLSIDMMELMCTLKQTLKSDEDLDEALTDLESIANLKKSGLFTLDPEYRPEEKHYRKTLENLERPSLMHRHFHDTIDTISFLNLEKVPVIYKRSIIKELLSPFLAFQMLSLITFQKTQPLGIALYDNLKRAGLTDPEKHLLKYTHDIRDISSTDDPAITTFLYKILDRERLLSPKPKSSSELKEIHEFLSFLLKDPRIGYVLPLLLLERSDTLERLTSDIAIEKLFPSFFHAKYAFIMKINDFVSQPGFNQETGTQILYQFLKDEPIHEQRRLSLIFFEALHTSEQESAPQITENLLGILWHENPILVEKSFLSLLQSHTSDELSLSSVFPVFVDFFWNHDSAFITSKLSADKLNVNLWPMVGRALIRKHFPLDLEEKTAPLPENFLEEIFTKDLSGAEKQGLRYFLSTYRIGNFTKTRRGDH
ncbi:MAG: hypothetical protein NTX49_07455, partial [Chlamydiae bacterium]|nr:hypothetical protein [Chlamydiota bacterium]